MTNDRAYGMIFSDKVPIELWPVLTNFLKRSESVLLQYPRHSSERYLRSWRGLLTLLAAACHLGKFDFSDKDLVSANWSLLTDERLKTIWSVVAQRRGGAGSGKLVPGRDFVQSLCAYLETKEGITGKGVVGKFVLPGPQIPEPPPMAPEFIQQVRALLPKQPWPTGVHSQIAAKLGVGASHVRLAIAFLIRREEFFDQRDGVLFDLDGNIVSSP
jgi:hypothetical protein